MHGNYRNIRVILVNTSHPGNIGGAARAIKNMGVERLYLVAPLEFPADRALWRAASAVDVLDNAVVVATLDEALAGCGLVVGTSARERSIPWPLLDPRQCGERVWRESAAHEVALVFGREDRGLTNDELHKCHYHVHIPASETYSSLNLAAAVQILAYEVRMAALAAAQGEDSARQSWTLLPQRWRTWSCISNIWSRRSSNSISMIGTIPAKPWPGCAGFFTAFAQTRWSSLFCGAY